MKKKVLQIEYDYLVRNISEGGETAYEAYIPAFNGFAFGDNMEELEEGIRFSIESEIAERKKNHQPIPLPDKQKNFSGKFVVRVTPSLHEMLVLKAKAARKSLNAFIGEKLLKV